MKKLIFLFIASFYLLAGTYGVFASQDRRLILEETTPETLERYNIPILTFSKEEPDIPIYSLKLSPSVPTATVGLTPAKDQKDLGLCASFCTGACVEFYYPNYRVSEAYLTVEAEKSGEDNTADCKEGLSLAAGMAIARDKGLVEQSNWEYDVYLKAVLEKNKPTSPTADHKSTPEEEQPPKDVCLELPELTSFIRLKFNSVVGVYNVSRDDIEEYIKRKIEGTEDEEELVSRDIEKSKKIVKVISKQLIPVAVSIPVFWCDSAGWESKHKGVITFPDFSKLKDCKESDYPKKGWHAITICAYNDHKRTFRFKNSWGDWGKSYGYLGKGFGTIPYEYINTLSDFATYGTH